MSGGITNLVRKSIQSKLAKLLGGDKPQRFYHGTTRQFENFDPEFKVTTAQGRDFEGSNLKNRGSHYFTPNPEAADLYAKSGKDPRTGEPFKSIDPETGEFMTGAVQGSRVIPVYLKEGNYFDVDNPDHLKTFKESAFYKENKEKLDEKFKFIGADFDTLLKSGEELALEEITPELKKLGFQGHTTYLDGNKNIAVYDTDLIVSGVAKKAKGGAVDLARAIGQGITFGFGDELEARIRSLAGGRTYGEEVADIRERIKKFRETNPVAAYGSEIIGSIPTGVGIAGLALRGGLRGAAKIGALEGGIYGIGEGEGLEGRATGAGLGAGLGAAGGKAAEKVFEGIAPLVGRFMKKTRGSEDVTIDSSPPDRRPMVKEAGSDEFVPLEKKVGKPGTRELKKRALSTQDMFKNMGEEGALLEFPEIATGIDKYVYEIDFGALNNALKSDEYGPYADVMRANLDRTFPADTISVSRIEDYSDPRARKRSKNFFEVNKDDVLFVGNESEKELIVRKPDGSPMSVRIADEQKGVEGKVSSSLKKGPFGVNPPVINQFKGDYLERPKPNIGRLAQDYSPVYNSLLDPKTLGFSPSVSKKSLTGERIIKRLKDQQAVTKDELAYLDLENSLVKKDKYSLEDVRAIVRASEPRIEIRSSSLDEMNPDFEITYYDEQRIIPQGRERDYIEYVFQDQRPSLPSVKNIEGPLDEVELEVLRRINDRIIENSASSKFSHYPDLENVIGHARVAKIDSPFDARDNAIVIEEIQSDLIAASNPKTDRMGDREYATPEKVGQALKEAQDFYKRNPKIKELEQEIINTKKELDRVTAGVAQMVDYDDLTDIEVSEKLANLKDELSDSLENLTDDEFEKASGFVTGNIKKKFIQNPPFSTNKAAARYFMQNVIKDAVRGGTKTILLPDYVDLANYHGKEDVKAFKLNYTDVFEKLISDYKKQGMRLKTGTVDISDDFSPELPTDLPFENRELRKLRPMKYVTFLNSFDDIDRSLIRRYSKGGKVDIKGGIGAMAPTHM